MTVFESLLVAHLVMDWLFQTDWQATHKHASWRAALAHCAVYAFGFVPVFLFYHISWWWFLILFASHVVLDHWPISEFVLRFVKHARKDRVPENLWLILNITIDQVLHIAVLALIASLY